MKALNLIATEKLGKKFMVSEMSPYNTYQTKDLEGYRVTAGVFESTNPFYFQSINVKVKNTNPSLSSIDKPTLVEFINLKVTSLDQYGEARFVADDIKQLKE